MRVLRSVYVWVALRINGLTTERYGSVLINISQQSVYTHVTPWRVLAYTCVSMDSAMLPDIYMNIFPEKDPVIKTKQ